jgi:phosphonopyruvate decarboxylase
MKQKPLYDAIFLRRLKDAGYYWFTGVPCSYFESFRLRVLADPKCKYIPAANEGLAISIAAGLYLSGHKTAVLMQNSGLGNAINPLSSLTIPYKIPLLLIISWRGEPGKHDANHHICMGNATAPILNALHIPINYLTNSEVLEHFDFRLIEYLQSSTAFIISRGLFPSAKRQMQNIRQKNVQTECDIKRSAKMRYLNADKVIARIDAVCTDAVIVSTTGFISRSLYQSSVSVNHFYMQGSMGHAAAIGLGIACGKPQKKVVIIDGDGALVMHLGILADVGASQNIHFIHIVLDNQQYDSTGGQAVSNAHIDFLSIANACLYDSATSCTTITEVKAALQKARSGKGKHFIHILTKASTSVVKVRPDTELFGLTQQIRDFIQNR